MALPSPFDEGELIREMGVLLDPGRVLASAAARRAYDCDAYTVDRSKPTAVVLPESTEEVQAVVRWCAGHDVPFTARGAGTGLSGGTLPALGGVVISTKRMRRILDIDVPNRCLKAQAGAVNARLTAAVAGDGLHFAPDPSSQSVATLGGNIGENSGGPHTLKYGVTVQHVLAVTLVTPEGERVELGSRVPDAPGYDLVGVVVGAEGTVGIVTEAWVKLTPLPPHVETALASFPSVRAATQTVAQIIAEGVVPAALEFMDHGVLRAVSQAFDLTYPEGSMALLLIECDGAREDAEREMAAAEAICRAHGALDVAIAKTEAERQRLWIARKKGIGAMGRLAPSIVTHDGVIPRSKLPEMLDTVYETAARYGVGVANIFHAGDGNLHPCFYFDDREPRQVEAVVAAGEELMKRCIELGGSVSGEHGIGVEKLDLMGLMFDEPSLRMQADVKAIFTDGRLCNPCKVLPNQKGCIEHRKRWRGVGW